MSITPTSAKIRVCYIPLVEQRNMSLDDFNSHYTGLISADSGFLAMKGVPNIELDMSVRIADIDSEAFRSTMKYNYAVIQTTANTPIDVKNYYFYIRDIQREANNVIRLSLHMDVLNTYKQWTSYLSDRTLIKRQHEDRYIEKFGKWLPLVDRVSEGIYLRKYRKSTSHINDPITGTEKWYLIYRTPDMTASDYDANNPLTCECVPYSSVKISDASSSGSGVDQRINAADLSIGGGYYILEDSSPGFSYTPEGGTTATNHPTDPFPRLFMTLFYTDDGSTIKVVQYEGTKGANGWIIRNIIPLEPLNPYTYIVFHTATFAYRLGAQTTDIPTIMAANSKLQINAGSTSVSAVYSSDFDDIDRTDPKIVKIVELPYPPATLVVSGGNYSFLESFTYSEDREAFIKNDLYETTYNHLNSALAGPSAIAPVSLGAARSLKDPKLWHSDFSSTIFRFDNFAYEIKAETLETSFNAINFSSEIERFEMDITFYPSSDVSSNFLFEIKPRFYSHTRIHDENEYPGFLLTGRNNDKPIFNNAYLNYMRTGYNYDIKTRNLDNILSIVNAGAAASGAALAGAFGGPFAAALSAGVGLAASFINTLGTMEKRDMSIERNLVSLQNQAVNVAGSGDLSLFDVYGGDFQVSLLQPADAEMDKIDDLFYYFGYSRNIFGKPNIASRSYFNFLQCEPDFYDAYGLYLPGVDIPKWALDEIVNKCKEGITFFHWVNSAYDLAQKKENLETSLL